MELWQSAMDLMDCASAYSTVTGNPEYLQSIGNPAIPAKSKPERSYKSPRLQTAEHFVPWCREIPETVGTEKDMRRACVEWSVQEYLMGRWSA